MTEIESKDERAEWTAPVLEDIGMADEVAATSNHINTDGLGGPGLS